MKLSCEKPAPYDYPQNPQTFGEHLRKRRLDSGLLQRELAEKLGVTTQSIRFWETNTTRPMNEYMPRVIEFLGYDPSPKANSKDISEFLKRYRRKHGLSQRQLASVLGVDNSSISSWETGQHEPTEKSKQILESIGIGREKNISG